MLNIRRFVLTISPDEYFCLTNFIILHLSFLQNKLYSFP